MTYRRVRYTDWTLRLLFAVFMVALFVGLPQRTDIAAWLAFITLFAVAWWAGGSFTKFRIAKATQSWRFAHYPDRTSPSFLRFIESLGADLGGHFENLTPSTPLAEMDWTTLQARVEMDDTHPCKRWVDFLLDHAEITGVDTNNLADKTLDDLITMIDNPSNA